MQKESRESTRTRHLEELRCHWFLLFLFFVTVNKTKKKQTDQ